MEATRVLKEEARDASMQLVAKFCSEQLGKYMACVNDNPHSWDKDCEELKIELASCAQKNPTIKNIRENCVTPFTSYEMCIRQNVQEVWKCNTQLSDFIECAEKHAGGNLTN